MAACFRAASGLAPPHLQRLVTLLDQLLTVPKEKKDLLGEVPEPDLAPLQDLEVFSGERWGAASALLELDEVPRRLSGLLAEARRIDPDLPHLVALLALHAFSPEIGVALRQGDSMYSSRSMTGRRCTTGVSVERICSWGSRARIPLRRKARPRPRNGLVVLPEKLTASSVRHA